MEIISNSTNDLTSQENTFLFLTKFISSNTSFTYSLESLPFYKALSSLIEYITTNHINSIMNSTALKLHPQFNPKQFHDTLLYTFITNFDSFDNTNPPSSLSSYIKSTLLLSKLYIQCNYPSNLFISILKSFLLLSTVKVDLNKNISHKNYNIKNYFFYETAFDILVNTFVNYNSNTCYTEQNEKDLNEFINYFNNTYIQANKTNVLLIINYSYNNFNLFTLMSSLLTKASLSGSKDLAQSTINLFINIYKYNFNYISCMKQCIYLSMNAYINFNTTNTPIQNKTNLSLIDFPISFITSLIKSEENSNENITSDMFYFNNKRACVFLEDSFDFSYSYFIISSALYPKANMDIYTILQLEKKDESEKIEVAIIKNESAVVNNINKKKIYYPNEKDLSDNIDKNKQLYRLIIRICYKKKPQNDVLIETCIYIEPYMMNVFILHFEKDKVEIYCKTNTNTFTKNIVNIKAFTKNKMKLLIGNNSVSFNSKNIKNTVFNGFIGPIICFKELNEEQIKHLFSLNGCYECLLFGDKYDFTHELKYHGENNELNESLLYFILNPIPTEHILLFISPLSFQFIPYKDYYSNRTHIKTNEISKHVLKKSNYARIRNTKYLSFKSKCGICGEHFHQKFAYVKHKLSKYELLRNGGIQFISLCLEFHFQFLLYYQNDVELYKKIFYNQITNNINNLLTCISDLILNIKLFSFIKDLWKMFYTLNKLFDKFCHMDGNINDIYPGLNKIVLSLSNGCTENQPVNKEQKQNIQIKKDFYKCFCKMILNSDIQCNDVNVLVSKFFSLISNLGKCPKLLNDHVLDKLLSYIDIVLYSDNTNETYINSYNDFLCSILSVNTESYANDNKEEYTSLVNYFYMNYIERLRLEDKDKTVIEKDKVYYMRYYFKLYQLLLIVYKEHLCQELNEISLNVFVELYEEIRIRIEYVEKDAEVLNIFKKVLKVIVLIFLEYGTGENKLLLLEKKVYKLKELPCNLFTVETILSSMIAASSPNEVIEFNNKVNFTLNYSQNMKNNNTLINRFNIIMSILCRNRDNNCFTEYAVIYDLIIKCFYEILKLYKEKHSLYNEFFSYKQHVCISFFAVFLFYAGKHNNNESVSTETNKTSLIETVWNKDEEFKKKTKKDFLFLTELLIFTHSEPFPLYLLNIIISRNYIEVDSQLTFDVLIEFLNIITVNKNKDTFTNVNYLSNVIEILKLVQFSYYRYKSSNITLYKNDSFIKLYLQICATIQDMSLIYLKIFYSYIDISKKATPNEFIFDFLLKLYQDIKHPKYLNALSNVFLIKRSKDVNDAIEFDGDNTNESILANIPALVKSYNSLLYEIDIWEFKYQDKYKTIMDNLKTGLTPFEEVNDFLLTQFYLGKVVLSLYLGSKQEPMDSLLLKFYNIFGEILFNDYGMLLNESKLMKRNKKRKIENIPYEQVGIMYNKMKAKQRTFELFKKMCFDSFDKIANIEGYANISSYSIIKKIDFMNVNNSNDNININIFGTNTSNLFGNNSSIGSGGSSNDNKNTRSNCKGKSISSIQEDINCKTLSPNEQNVLFFYEEESGNQSSSGLEHNSIELGNPSTPSLNNQNKQQLSNSQLNIESNVIIERNKEKKFQTQKQQAKGSFFSNIFNFSKKNEQTQGKTNLSNTTSNQDNKSHSLSNISLNDFKEITIHNCILSPKKELLMSHFADVFKAVYFYNEEFVHMKKHYINEFLNENTGTKQLNYPCKIRNFSNTIEPNYFLKQDKHFYTGNPYFKISHQYYENKWNVNNEKKIIFNKPHLAPTNIEISNDNVFDCELITNEKNIFGRVILSNEYLLFENVKNDPRKSSDINIQLDYIFSSLEGDIIVKEKQIIIFYQNIVEFLLRRFLFMWQSIEVYLKDGRSYFFNFFDEEKQKAFTAKLKSILKEHKHSIKIVLSLDVILKIVKENEENWKNGTITVYDYLLLINKYSSRTYKDLNQYPIFPWVTINILCVKNLFNLVDDNLKDRITKPNDFVIELHEKYSLIDFDDKKAQIKDVKISRRMRLFLYPICVQTEEKKQTVISKYNDYILEDTFPHHIGNFYSTASFICYYLMRLPPFNNALISLQSGYLENPNRMFTSFKDIANIFKQSYDARELIPEVYSMIEYMINFNCACYGNRMDSSLVDDISLGKETTVLEMYVKFLFQQKKLLNSDAIANEIHHWINYVFGVNQLSDDETSCTVFPKRTYAQKARLSERKLKYLNKLTPLEAKRKLKAKMNEMINFGQNPHKIFNDLHPKYKKNLVNTKENQDELIFLLSKDIKHQEYIDEHSKDNQRQFRYLNVSYDSSVIYYVYREIVHIKTFKPNEHIKTETYVSINNLLKNSSFRKQITSLYNFKKTQNIPRNYKSTLISPKYCNVLICKNSFFISCRHLDFTFKVYKVAKKTSQEHIWSVYTGSFVSSICKVSEHAFITGHHNGILSEWKLKIEGNANATNKTKDKDKDNSEIRPKCVHVRQITSHEKAITAIEYYARLNVIITASEDNYIYIRKYYDLELLSFISIPSKYKIIEVNISSLNMVYVLCYNCESKCNVVMGYTLNGIKFAESSEGVYTNIQFTKNGNVIVGDIDNGYIQILTSFALNVFATAKIRTNIYKENVGNEDRLIDMVWIKYLIEETLLIVGVAKGYVLYYRMLEDEPENKMFS